MMQLNEDQLYEKCYLTLLSNVNLTKINNWDTVTYPQMDMDVCEECAEKHGDDDETFELDWSDDLSLKLERLASTAVRDILGYRKAVQERAVQETKN